MNQALTHPKPEDMKCERHLESKFRALCFTQNGKGWLNNNVLICDDCAKGKAKHE